MLHSRRLSFCALGVYFNLKANSLTFPVNSQLHARRNNPKKTARNATSNAHQACTCRSQITVYILSLPRPRKVPRIIQLQMIGTRSCLANPKAHSYKHLRRAPPKRNMRRPRTAIAIPTFLREAHGLNPLRVHTATKTTLELWTATTDPCVFLESFSRNYKDNGKQSPHSPRTVPAQYPKQSPL